MKTFTTLFLTALISFSAIQSKKSGYFDYDFDYEDFGFPPSGFEMPYGFEDWDDFLPYGFEDWDFGPMWDGPMWNEDFPPFYEEFDFSFGLD